LSLSRAAVTVAAASRIVTQVFGQLRAERTIDQPLLKLFAQPVLSGQVHITALRPLPIAAQKLCGSSQSPTRVNSSFRLSGSGPDDVEILLKHRLYMLIGCIKVIAIDRGIVVAVLLGKAMRKIPSAAGIHELALSALLAEID